MNTDKQLLVGALLATTPRVCKSNLLDNLSRVRPIEPVVWPFVNWFLLGFGVSKNR
jgi:hypothetical protein